MTQASRTIAQKLGDVSDEPWRAASWLGYAKQYGFDTPVARRELLTSNAPEIKRVRDDISQRVRDDMLDFDTLTPNERERLTRVFFVWAFKRAALKWPAMYLREYPERAAILSLLAAQHEYEGTPGRATSALESGRVELGGRETDIGWLSPVLPAAEMIEDAEELAGGIEGERVNLRQLTRQLAPQYRWGVDSAGWGGASTESAAGWAIPGYSTVDRIARGGGLGEQTLRALGSTIDYIEPVPRDPRREAIEEGRAVIAGLRRNRPELLRENPGLVKRIQTAYSRKLSVDLMRRDVEREFGEPGIEREREKLRRETTLLRSWGVLSPAKASEVLGVARSGSLDDVKGWRNILREEGFDDQYLGLLREVRETAGVSP